MLSLEKCVVDTVFLEHGIILTIATVLSVVEVIFYLSVTFYRDLLEP